MTNQDRAEALASGSGVTVLRDVYCISSSSLDRHSTTIHSQLRPRLHVAQPISDIHTVLLAQKRPVHHHSRKIHPLLLAPFATLTLRQCRFDFPDLHARKSDHQLGSTKSQAIVLVAIPLSTSMSFEGMRSVPNITKATKRRITYSLLSVGTCPVGQVRK